MAVVSFAGLAILIALCRFAGGWRQTVNRRVVLWGTAMQLLFGLVVFRTGIGKSFLLLINDFVNEIVKAAIAGPAFVVGALSNTGATAGAGLGFILLTQGLLSIIVIASMLQLLYQFGIMGWVVKAFASVFSRVLRVSGVEALAASANIFIGNETIITVRPFLARMTRSEMCVLMTACMATVSANMMGAYVAVLGGVFPGIAGHIASASLLSAPAALVAAKLIYPETASPETLGVRVEPHIEKSPNIVSAVMAGAEAGGKLLVGISLLLIAVVGLLGIADALCGWLGGYANTLLGWECQWSIANLLGFVFRPFAWLMGVPWNECAQVGELLGVRAVTSEIGAYPRLAMMMESGAVGPRTAAIAAYALCGFAHIPAVAITAGGVAALVPERKEELSTIAPKAFVAATIACLMTGCIAGIFASDTQELLLGTL